MASGSANVQQLHVENQRRPGRNGRRSARGSVAEIRRDDQLPPAADLHARYTFVPTGNDLSRTERKAEWLVPVPAAVELLAVREPPGVVHLNGSVGHGLGALALRDILIPEAGWSLRHGGGIDLESGGEAGGRLPVATVGWAAAGESSKTQKQEAVQSDSDV